MIYKVLFNIVMHRVGSRDYVSDRDHFCIYKVMVGEKVNFPKIIFYCWMQVFKDIFNHKVKKNLIPYGMLFT